jgi:hypothetical protein
MKTLTRLTLLLVTVLALAIPAGAQTATTQTTLSVAITTPTPTAPTPATTVTLTSGTGVVVGSFLQMDQELMVVTDISATPTFTTRRSGQGGTTPSPHAAGAVVWVVPPTSPQTLTTVDQAGACTPTRYQYLPLINARTGQAWNCSLINATVYEWEAVQTGNHISARRPFTAVANASATVANAYTIKVTDDVIILTTTGTGSGALAGPISTWTLPSHIGLSGKMLIIKDGSGGVTATTFIALSGTIDNVATTTLGVYLKTAYGGVQLVAGSGGWFTVSCYRSLLCQ